MNEKSLSHPITSQDPYVGMVIQDRYRIIKKLGEGGMGAIYLGEHMMIKRKVAIKCLHSQFAGNQEIVARFHREALAATAIGDEHIVEVTDMGHFHDGSLFMVLEYLEGHDFSKEIEKNGPQPLGRVANIICQMCDALIKVHSKGIVHRDLKPENIFLIRRGDNPDFVKILDFGISKFKTSLDGNSARMTATGAALGTPYFMSPEQAEGTTEVDHRTDIYALGCIMYHALTAQFPFEEATLPMLIVAICTKPPRAIRTLRPDLPDSAMQIIVKALAKDKNDRFSDCAELKRALLPYRNLSDSQPHATTPTNDGQAISHENISDHLSFAETGMMSDEAKQNHSGGQLSIAGSRVDSLGQTAVPIEIPHKAKRVQLMGGIAITATLVVGLLIYLGLSSGDEVLKGKEHPPTVAAVPMPAQTSKKQVTSSAEFSKLETAEDIRVRISTEPVEAVLFLDGARIANPFDGELPKGEGSHNLEARLDGYKSASQKLVLRYPQTVHLRLRPETKRNNVHTGGRRRLKKRPQKEPNTAGIIGGKIIPPSTDEAEDSKTDKPLAPPVQRSIPKRSPSMKSSSVSPGNNHELKEIF